MAQICSDVSNATCALTVHQLFQSLSLALIFTSGIVLNLIIIIVFVGSPPIRAVKSNLGILNLVICDMIFIAFVMPMSFVPVVWPENDMVISGPLCQATGFLSVVVCTSSSLTLAFIAVDRYLAAVHPIFYFKQIKPKQCLVVLGVCWIWSALTALPPLLPSRPVSLLYNKGTKHCSPSFKADCWYFWYCVVMGYGIPLPIMTVCYFKIYITIRNHRRKVFGQPEATSRWEEVTRITVDDGTQPIFLTEQKFVTNVFKERRVTKNVQKPQVQIAKRGALLIIAYFMCWGPYAVLNSCVGHFDASEWVEVMSMWIVYTLVIWNPLIYVFNNKEFRYELNRLYLRIQQGIRPAR